MARSTLTVDLIPNPLLISVEIDPCLALFTDKPIRLLEPPKTDEASPELIKAIRRHSMVAAVAVSDDGWVNSSIARLAARGHTTLCTKFPATFSTDVLRVVPPSPQDLMAVKDRLLSKKVAMHDVLNSISPMYSKAIAASFLWSNFGGSESSVSLAGTFIEELTGGGSPQLLPICAYVAHAYSCFQNASDQIANNDWGLLSRLAEEPVAGVTADSIAVRRALQWELFSRAIRPVLSNSDNPMSAVLRFREARLGQIITLRDELFGIATELSALRTQSDLAEHIEVAWRNRVLPKVEHALSTDSNALRLLRHAIQESPAAWFGCAAALSALIAGSVIPSALGLVATAACLGPKALAARRESKEALNSNPFAAVYWLTQFVSK